MDINLTGRHIDNMHIHCHRSDFSLTCPFCVLSFRCKANMAAELPVVFRDNSFVGIPDDEDCGFKLADMFLIEAVCLDTYRITFCPLLPLSYEP